MTFQIKEDNFYLNDEKVFLNSGEIHYFRIKRDLWSNHLEAALEAGLTTVSTYIPWAWHEPEEGIFDFEGTTAPERDLKGWMQLCKSYGLSCIVKPGPFILAEFRGAGLPDWFMNKHGEEIKMRNSKGGIVQSDGVNIFHPLYLEKVTRWYGQVMPFLRHYQVSAGGPVIMMQICNEIGVFNWLARQADYSIDIKNRFITFISNKFNDIEQVNRLWETNYCNFTEIDLPPDGRLPYSSKGDRSRDYEWHCFWRTCYGDYLRMLTVMARERGITVPLYHNLPGWIYGNGYEFPVNITMYEDLFNDKSELIFGVDHIPEFMSNRNMHDDRIINDITHAMQGSGPLFAAEFQSGSREYHVVTSPNEMELFYKASIAHGLTGWNYYMFSQGHNPPKKGYSGSTFYWFTPLSAEGMKTSAFDLIKRMSKIVKTVGNIIVDAKRKSEIAVLFYPPYYATELERPVDQNCGLMFTPSAIRRPAYFDGLLKILQVLNIDYDMIDLTRATAGMMNKYKQVWAFTTDEMNAADQQTIVDYVKAGGHMVMFPYLPDREMTQKTCTIIRDALSVKPSRVENIDSPLIDVFDLKDIKCANPQVIYNETSLADAEIFARTIRGSACGFIKTLGNGSVTHLGTWTGFDTEGHKPVYETILSRSGAKLRQAMTTNEHITVRERFTSQNTALLFIANYYHEEQPVQVKYTHPGNGEIISVPFVQEKMLWPALYGLLSPVCLKITDDISILHTTSDILNIFISDNQIEISLFGHRDLAGEMVFEGKDVNKINTAAIDGEPLSIIRKGSRIAFVYPHRHKTEMLVKIKLM